MPLIVQKFGCSSVVDADKIRNVCSTVAEAKAQGHQVVVVLSAQGDTTDDLIAKMEEITDHASLREKDMLLSAGAQVLHKKSVLTAKQYRVPVEVLSGFQRIPGTNVCEFI